MHLKLRTSPKMGMEIRKRLFRTLIILIAVLGSSLAAYEGLIVALGIEQPIMIVVSDSMEPTIGLGDFVAVRTVRLSQISIGNVIVYEKSLSNTDLLCSTLLLHEGRQQFRTRSLGSSVE